MVVNAIALIEPTGPNVFRMQGLHNALGDFGRFDKEDRADARIAPIRALVIRIIGMAEGDPLALGDISHALLQHPLAQAHVSE